MPAPAPTPIAPSPIRFPTPTLPASEYLDVPGAGSSRQKQMKQSQKEAEKRARKEAKEAEKYKAQWEKGERERQKAEEKEARELERARARDRGAAGSVASSAHQRSVSAVVPGALPTRERKLSNAMGFDKYGDTLAGQMDALTLGGAADPAGAARRERRTSTAGPPPPGVGTASRTRRYSNAGYDRDPYAGADSAAAYDRRAAAAQQAQDDAYARAASNAYYVQGERAAAASVVGDPAGPPPLAGVASQSMWDPRGREREYARDRSGVRERDYAGREHDDPYAPPVPGAYPTGASRSPYEDPLRAAPGVPGAIPGAPPPVDPYAAAGAPAYAHNAPYAGAGAAPGAYGAAPSVAGSHHSHSPSGYAPAITPSHSPYARDPALGAVPGVPAANDPYAANSSYYGAAGASRYGGAPGYAGAQDRSPYGTAAQGPPPLTSAVPGAAAGAYAYSSRSPHHDPYAAAAAAPYGGASRSPYDRHSAPPAPRGDPYAPVPGASVGAYGQQPPSPYDRNPVPPAAGAYGAPGAYGAGARAPSPLPYGAAAGARAPSPLPYGAAAGGRGTSPMRYPRHAAEAYAQHVQDGDPALGMGMGMSGGRSGPPSPYERDPYGGHRGGGGYEPEPEPMPSSPPGFHRQPSQSHKYTPFEAFLILDDLNGFYRETPHMPAALVSHDVFHEDWIRFMQDLAFAWSGRIPAPELGRDGRQPHPGAIVADLVDVWNMRFFHPRRVELIVYHGRTPVSGRRGAPGEEDDHSSRKWSLCLRCLSGGSQGAAGFPPGVAAAYA
ncbi:hypothetical protein AURDEDRAFT_119658 [Auricularia subglabra TFB-10046 SS5]|nr:hypothetical protein AURDEDRAFT_119658 [Auricularia subglabra TFB-10046 SS5]